MANWRLSATRQRLQRPIIEGIQCLFESIKKSFSEMEAPRYAVGQSTGEDAGAASAAESVNLAPPGNAGPRGTAGPEESAGPQGKPLASKPCGSTRQC